MVTTTASSVGAALEPELDPNEKGAEEAVLEPKGLATAELAVVEDEDGTPGKDVLSIAVAVNVFPLVLKSAVTGMNTLSFLPGTSSLLSSEGIRSDS